MKVLDSLRTRSKTAERQNLSLVCYRNSTTVVNLVLGNQAINEQLNFESQLNNQSTLMMNNNNEQDTVYLTKSDLIPIVQRMEHLTDLVSNLQNSFNSCMLLNTPQSKSSIQQSDATDKQQQQQKAIEEVKKKTTSTTRSSSRIGRLIKLPARLCASDNQQVQNTSTNKIKKTSPIQIRKKQLRGRFKQLRSAKAHHNFVQSEIQDQAKKIVKRKTRSTTQQLTYTEVKRSVRGSRTNKTTKTTQREDDNQFEKNNCKEMKIELKRLKECTLCKKNLQSSHHCKRAN